MSLPGDYSMFATNSRVAFIDALNDSSRQHCRSERSKESLIISAATLNDNQGMLRFAQHDRMIAIRLNA